MIRTLGAMRASASYLSQTLVAAVPCCTFHSPSIFEIFKSQAAFHFPDVIIVNLMEEIIVHLKERMPPDKNVVGVMSTTGTRGTKLYNNLLQPLGYVVVEIDDDIQEELHDTIYSPFYGLKSVIPASTRAKRNIERYVRMLIEKGAAGILLGCTEIPLALPKHFYRSTPLIDPLTALARGLIRTIDASRLATMRSPDPMFLEAGLIMKHDG